MQGEEREGVTMFSGIIEELGTVESISNRGVVAVLSIKAGKAAGGVAVGDSVAVNGACLTAVAVSGENLRFDVLRETMSVAGIGRLRRGDRVNLERSLKMGDRISGHFVTGHIDCAGTIRKKSHVRGNLCFEIALPARFSSYVLPKGSIAVDGISLTVADKGAGSFSVYVIPHTLAHTTLNGKGPGHEVNIEFDVLAKAAVSRNSAAGIGVFRHSS